MLTKSHRDVMNLIGKYSKGGLPRFHHDGKATYFLPDGKRLRKTAALTELIEWGVFRPAEDGLFPGHPQSWVFDSAGYNEIVKV